MKCILTFIFLFVTVVHANPSDPRSVEPLAEEVFEWTQTLAEKPPSLFITTINKLFKDIYGRRGFRQEIDASLNYSNEAVFRMFNSWLNSLEETQAMVKAGNGTGFHWGTRVVFASLDFLRVDLDHEIKTEMFHDLRDIIENSFKAKKSCRDLLGDD